MSDGMSDARNYGPSLSKWGHPTISMNGKPIKNSAGNWEIRKCQGEGWNVYAILPGPQPMFAAHYGTEKECEDFVAGKDKA